MYSMEDILSLLHEGQTADDIAKSFTDQLNAALKAQEEEIKAQEEAKAKAKEAELQANKRNDILVIVGALFNYLEKYCGLPHIEEFPEEKEIDGFIEGIEQIGMMYAPMLAMAQTANSKNTNPAPTATTTTAVSPTKATSKKSCTKPTVTVKTMSTDEADKIIDNFLKNFWAK